MSRTEGEHGRVGNGSAGTGTTIVNSMDQMMRLPLQMTGATWDFMMQGMRNMTGAGQRLGSAATDLTHKAESQIESLWRDTNPQDLGGDDLKYVTWSLVFTKPGYECVLEPQRCELVNYDADVSSFAAVRIAKFLEKARHGHAEKAEAWQDHHYPPEHQSESGSRSSSTKRGWRIPTDDQKYIVFLHRVEWRLPKQEEVTRSERVTIERSTKRVA